MRMHAFSHDTPNDGSQLDKPRRNGSQEESVTLSLKCYENRHMEWRGGENHVTRRRPV